MLDSIYTKWFSKSTIDNLETYGNCKIVKISLAKHDILYKFLRYSFMNVLSDGLWSKELIKRNINKLKHTYIICTIKDDTDKQINIVISKEFTFRCETRDDWIKYLQKENREEEIIELTSFNPDINININLLLDQTIKNIGDENFFIWTPMSSCQDFTKNIVVTIDAFNYKYALLHKHSNIRLYDDFANNFITQHIDNLFSIMPKRVDTVCNVYILCMKKFYGIDMHY